MRAHFLLLSLIALPGSVLAAEPVTNDCIIRDFKSDITLNQDSSALIKEALQVDCGNLPDKHGIFRVVPREVINRPDGVSTYTPVTLASITDGTGSPVPFDASYTHDSIRSLTWKIGDPNKTIDGLTTYLITYSVYNATYQDPASGKDRFYWNLSGNSWVLPIENYSATIHFLESTSRTDIDYRVYAGKDGTPSTLGPSDSHWQDDHTLLVSAPAALSLRDGLTIDAHFPHVVTPFVPPATQWWWLAAVPLTLGLMILIWKKYGKDPAMSPIVAPEYEPPRGLRPLELGMIERFGAMPAHLITATIIDLAVRGYIKIEEVEPDGIKVFGRALGGRDWRLTRNSDASKQKIPLVAFEKTVLSSLFSEGQSVLLSSQKQKFYTKISSIRYAAKSKLETEGFLEPSRWKITVLLVLLVALSLTGLVASFVAADVYPYAYPAAVTAILCLMIVLATLPFMSRRTRLGAETMHQIKGFRLYMKTAEQYRQQFFEKENIFETFLPYAIAFSLTSVWIDAAKKLYADSSMGNRAFMPLWYSSILSDPGSFDSFTDSLNAVTQSMSTSLASTPGGGAGGSGGGGGGGGGGSW